MTGETQAVMEPVPEAVRLPRLVRELLRQRGIIGDELLQQFLHPQYERLADPFLMKDMVSAVDRIMAAIESGEKVAIYGDYDIDGVASTALLLEVLQLHGLTPLTYIPDRYSEGYGLNVVALQSLQQQGATLVISVDCGITAVPEAEWANAHGLDLIITDHHEVPDQLPTCVAVVNPHQMGDEYPSKELAGVGVVFALARALQSRTDRPAPGQEKWLLDLVALGTVCDVMPLVGENRTMAKFGLMVLQKTRRRGLVALAQSAGVDLAQSRAYHLGFVLGPRMNAAGRLEHANYSLELITTKDPVDAQAIAFQLEEMNHQRQLAQKRIVEEVDAMAAGFAADPVLVLADGGWPHGVVGIVASKIAEKWQKPTLVLQLLEDGTAKGSGRSAGGYNLIEGLRDSANLFTKLGGHHFAAGFTLPADNLPALRTALGAHHALTTRGGTVIQSKEADIVVDDLADLNMELCECLEALEPFGSGNPQPVWGLQKVRVVAVDTIGKDRSHLKLRLSSQGGNLIEAVAFGMAERFSQLKAGQTVNVLGYLQKNEFNGRCTLQLVIVDIQ